MSRLKEPSPLDPIPCEDVIRRDEDEARGIHTYTFLAFNTEVTISAYGDKKAANTALEEAVAHCRRFERLFSRTLPHSDVSTINSSCGTPVEVHKETYSLLVAACRYCAESLGTFDITIGPAAKLWDFHRRILPDEDSLREAIKHVDWQEIRTWASDDGRFYAQLSDPHASLDLGGIAKGYIADCLTESIEKRGISSFFINLGGNVVVRGLKPGGSAWAVGIKNPLERDKALGVFQLRNASVVTSGVYERCFEHDGVLLHHILSPTDGRPVKTDVSGVTVVADKSIDAEGYSTTLLALGLRRGSEFVGEHKEIRAAFFVDFDNVIHTVQN